MSVLSRFAFVKSAAIPTDENRSPLRRRLEAEKLAPEKEVGGDNGPDGERLRSTCDPDRSAPANDEDCIPAPSMVTPGIVAPEKSIESSEVFLNTASVKLAPVKVQPASSDRSKMAPTRLAPARFAPERFAAVKSVLSRIAFSRNAPWSFACPN